MIDNQPETDIDVLIRKILRETRNIALIGASPKPSRPSHGVMAYMQARDYQVTPVNPGQTGNYLNNEICYAKMADIPGSFQMVEIFRNSHHAADAVDEAIELVAEKGIQTIWMQLGVINVAAEERALKAGLQVIMDRCPVIEIRRLNIA